MFKTALVVDDSRTAQLTLARLLKAQGLLVDTVESGPEALNYLRLNPPPVAIFLDHMMPGMDGFETLGAIKSNQATASIPVVMYTSKEDDSYFGEARTLGAAGVLQKPPQPLDVGRLLAALNVAGSAGAPSTRPEATPRLAAARVGGRSAPAPAPRVTPSTSPEAQASSSEPPTAAARTGSRVSIVSFVLSAAVVLLAVGAWWTFAAYRDAAQARDAALVQAERTKGELARRIQVEKQNAERSAPPAPAPLSRSLLNTIAWAINQSGHYDFDEIPLSDRRLQVLRALMERLSAAGFRGTIRLDTHLGEFCLVRDDQGRHRLPPPGTPLSDCEVVSYPPVEANRLAQRTSEAFSRFLAARAQAQGPIDIVVVSHGASRPLQKPADLPDMTTAAEWNAVARLNQRVEISLLPKGRGR